MKKGDLNSNGFTIIEVALVLAIAGLIFMMMFIALPALQRQQRNTARKENINALITSIKKYQTNNRGTLPGTSDTLPTTASYDASYNGAANKTTWKGFLRNYMENGFNDPSGNPYKLRIISCGTNKTDAVCTSAANAVNATFPNDYTIFVITEAKCSGNENTGALKASNPRRVAILYKLEGSGLYCANT